MGSGRGRETQEAIGTHRKWIGGVGRIREKGRPPNVPLGSGAPEALQFPSVRSPPCRERTRASWLEMT